ncbi:hypothetical protein GQ457_10G007320 [Hibiscus cannabinus]
MVSTPLHRGRQDLVVDQSETQLSGCPLHPPRETILGVNQSCGDMRAAAVFRVDAIVRVSTPLHRGRQDLEARLCYKSSAPPCSRMPDKISIFAPLLRPRMLRL